jgi:DtxR family Mn-dependent transcriptional regulator
LRQGPQFLGGTLFQKALPAPTRTPRPRRFAFLRVFAVKKRYDSYVPLERASVSREDYLKAILEMEQEGLIPIGVRLSESLRVTPPAVTAALKRLTRDGLALVDRHGRIRLTSQGAREAESLVVRHRLAEKLLTEVLGMEWSKVHEEAEKLEHAISPEVEKHLLKFFGNGGNCPHGNPLYGGLAALRKNLGAIRLSEVAPPAGVEVLRVNEDKGLLEFLSSLAIFPGTRLRIRSLSYDGTMVLTKGRKIIHLSESARAQIWVQRLTPAGSNTSASA